jgi:hypothetical protein
MAALTQGKNLADWLIEEFGAPNHCREEITVLSGQKLVSGAVVAKRNDGGNAGKVVEYEGDGANGTDVAVGILLQAVDASATGANADSPGVIIARGPATICKAGLTWKANELANDDIPEAIADLLALGIVAREGV